MHRYGGEGRTQGVQQEGGEGGEGVRECSRKGVRELANQ